ncbi:MAG: hypothetical protein V4850_01430 [Myxococcota bacterium]
MLDERVELDLISLWNADPTWVCERHPEAAPDIPGRWKAGHPIHGGVFTTGGSWRSQPVNVQSGWSTPGIHRTAIDAARALGWRPPGEAA